MKITPTWKFLHLKYTKDIPYRDNRRHSEELWCEDQPLQRNEDELGEGDEISTSWERTAIQCTENKTTIFQ